MKIIGVIAEYNPLHNGHMYHLSKIKEEKPDLIIGVISSSISMRGDLSIFDKFIKTKHALLAGVDIVIELPLCYSMQRADIFAKNAVSLLNLCHVNEIIIGSEQNNISLYENKYSLEIKTDSSMSLKASNKELLEFNSNDTLGYFYYKAIKDNKYSIELKTIKRIASHYKDDTLNNTFISSATSIRKNIDSMKGHVPDFVFENKDDVLNEAKLFPYLKYKILSSTKEDLKEIFFVDEGIEYKLMDISKFQNLDDFIQYLSGKKYTKTRIKRMLMYILFDIKKSIMNEIAEPSYVRVLGYNDKGRNYLNILKKDITIYTNIKNGLEKSLDIELKVTKILDSIYDKEHLKDEQKGPQYIK